MLASFGWVFRAMGIDHGLARVIKVGDLAQHCNGGQWGRVLEVHPRGDSAELVLERIVRPECKWDEAGLAYWATYHIKDWAPTYDVRRD